MHNGRPTENLDRRAIDETLDHLLQSKTNFESTFAEWKSLCYICQLVVIKSLNIVLLHEGIDVLLNIRYLRRESIADLCDDLFDQKDVLELLSALHDSNNNGLELLVM